MLSLELAHGLFGFEPTFDNLAKGRHGNGGFLRWIFRSQTIKEKSAKKDQNPPGNPPPDNKKSAGTQSPQNHQP